MSTKRDRLLTPFIERNLQLKGNRLPDARYDPSLSVEFEEENDNKITLIAWSGLPGEDGRQTPIKLNVEAYSFALLAKQAEKVSGIAPGTEFRGIKINGVRKKKPGDDSKGLSMGVDGTVFIGKDQQEVCYICIMARGVPKLKFPFRPSNWSEMVDVRTMEPAPLSLVSQDYAEAWSAMVLPIATSLLIAHPYDWKAAREDRNERGTGNSSGRNNNDWKNKSNESKAPAKDDFDGGGFDDDIPL